jgi:hypothetical protein
LSGVDERTNIFSAKFDGGRARVLRYFTHAVSSEAGPASVHGEFDFYSGGVRDGSWLHNEALRKVLIDGFRCQIDTRSFGHLPSKLVILSADERRYIYALLRDGVISRGDTIFSHRHFFCRDGGKLRLIFDGRRINARCAVPPVFPMLSHCELAAICGKRSWAAKFDLASFYWNIRLDPSMRHLFGFRTNLGNFVWNRLPFGFSHSAFQSNELAEAICLHLRSLGIDVYHYMDDFIVFGDTAEACERDLLHCISFCESIGVRVKDRKTVHATQRLHILGVFYDLIAKTSSMDRAFFDRLAHDLAYLDDTRIVKRSRFASFMGAALFLNAAYPGALSLFNDLIRWFNLTAHMSWSARIDVSAAIGLARFALGQASCFPPCTLQAHEGGGHRVFADATPIQLGVVIDGILHAQPIAELPIFEAEASALALALSLAGTRSNIMLVTDNRALFCAVRKGRSGNSLANCVIQDILFRRLNGAIIDIAWVQSADNPADIPSRADMTSDLSRNIIFHF